MATRPASEHTSPYRCIFSPGPSCPSRASDAILARVHGRSARLRPRASQSQRDATESQTPRHPSGQLKQGSRPPGQRVQADNPPRSSRSRISTRNRTPDSESSLLDAARGPEHPPHASPATAPHARPAQFAPEPPLRREAVRSANVACHITAQPRTTRRRRSPRSDSASVKSHLWGAGSRSRGVGVRIPDSSQPPPPGVGPRRAPGWSCDSGASCAADHASPRTITISGPTGSP